MQSLQKTTEEHVALVTPCFQAEEACGEFSLRCILVVFVVWTYYKNF